jgi:flagellar motor switch/type III secretory pathway protein FliN
LISQQIVESASEAVFGELKSLSRSEVELLNWYSSVFRDSLSWGSWVKEAFIELLEVSDGTIIQLTQSSELSQDKHTFRFEKNEIEIGRDPESDIVLDLMVISRRHAQIIRREGKYYLEDQGSGTGTYLNQKKLTANTPEALCDGDRILVFPYIFECQLEEIWRSQEPPALWMGPVETDSWEGFERRLPTSFCRFYIDAHPAVGELCIAGDRAFMQELVTRITRMPAQHLVESDSGIFQFLMAAILERANREIRFPFQFILQDRPITVSEFERGLSFDFSVGLSERTGSFKVFLPDVTLFRMRTVLSPTPVRAIHNALTCVLVISAGHLDLSASELADMEPGDIVLFRRSLTIALPSSYDSGELERGWHAKEVKQNPLHIELVAPFQQTLFMENEAHNEQESTAAKAPDLSRMPVRLHAVLGQVETTLTELESLAAGSILELNRTANDPVQLAVNGKILGSGRLVDVEGKLGVQISNWGAS